MTFFTGIARAPWVQVRLLLSKPDAWVPALVAGGLIVIAAAFEDSYRRDRRTRDGLSVVMIAAGVVLLAWFLRFGAIDLNQGPDWQKEWTYYTALKEALAAGRLPWTLRQQFQGTDQYLSNPETVFAPQVIALRWLTIQHFVLAQLLCYSAIGLSCILRLARELRFGALASLIVSMLFLLNGHVLSHLAQGHGQWVAYLLIPCVFLVIHRAANDHTSRANQVQLALALTGMVAVGGWHVFVWCSIFIAAFVAVCREAWRFVAGAALITVGLSAFRILPAVLVFGASGNEYLGSFDSLSNFAIALIGEPRVFMNGLDWWEFDTFIGWMGLVLLCLGVTLPLAPSRTKSLDYLWAPSLTMVVLGFYDIYRISLFQLAGFSSERVASRLVIVGVLGLVLIGCLQLNDWLRSTSAHRRRALVALATLFLAIQLIARAEAGRPARDRGQPPPVDVIKSDPPELIYKISVFGGLSISLAAAVLALRRLWTSQSARP